VSVFVQPRRLIATVNKMCRMPRECYLLALVLLLWPCPARAQPMIRVEHDWAVTLDGRRYGLVQVRQTPGDPFRRTEVWLGRLSFDVKGRAVEAIALILLSPADLMQRIDRRSFRRVP
jgi:hypothetical protein